MKKVCTKCHQKKDLTEFYKNKGHKEGLRSNCKKCEALRHKKYVETHREKIKAIDKKWRDAKIETIRAKDRMRGKAKYQPKIRQPRTKQSREEQLIKDKIYRQKNKKIISEYRKKLYRKTHPIVKRVKKNKNTIKAEQRLYQHAYYMGNTKIKRQQEKYGAN